MRCMVVFDANSEHRLYLAIKVGSECDSIGGKLKKALRRGHFLNLLFVVCWFILLFLLFVISTDDDPRRIETS